ncbi:unnamed protein product [Acanthosepion pharaonis]|uniref:Uncharacterized protein n=1 Tax=Acanthosepion pharaonis TaxID=158019 RepID=A0A812EU32_ACAPH|nr:unnamed protein product [Sepia pharaonis]
MICQSAIFSPRKKSVLLKIFLKYRHSCFISFLQAILPFCFPILSFARFLSFSFFFFFSFFLSFFLSFCPCSIRFSLLSSSIISIDFHSNIYHYTLAFFDFSLFLLFHYLIVYLFLCFLLFPLFPSVYSLMLYRFLQLFSPPRFLSYITDRFLRFLLFFSPRSFLLYLFRISLYHHSFAFYNVSLSIHFPPLPLLFLLCHRSLLFLLFLYSSFSFIASHLLFLFLPFFFQTTHFLTHTTNSLSTRFYLFYNVSHFLSFFSFCFFSKSSLSIQRMFMLSVPYHIFILHTFYSYCSHTLLRLLLLLSHCLNLSVIDHLHRF